MNSTTRSGQEAVTGGSGTDSSQRTSEPNIRATAADTMSDLGDAAKQAAETLVSATTEKLKDVANQQVAAGADLVGHVGKSVRVAGEHLQRNAPYLARFAFSASQTIEKSADQLRVQSIESLARNTAEFARERPEIVFGVAAVSGFLLFRLLNAGVSGATRPSYRSGDTYPQSQIQPARNPSFSPG
jgi:ElaB/YqjD/DUF883 family membrane-anchored ribosome-binding protein